jgi:hypothetical protein
MCLYRLSWGRFTLPYLLLSASTTFIDICTIKSLIVLGFKVLSGSQRQWEFKEPVSIELLI